MDLKSLSIAEGNANLRRHADYLDSLPDVCRLDQARWFTHGDSEEAREEAVLLLEQVADMLHGSACGSAACNAGWTVASLPDLISVPRDSVLDLAWDPSGSADVLFKGVRMRISEAATRAFALSVEEAGALFDADAPFLTVRDAAAACRRIADAREVLAPPPPPVARVVEGHRHLTRTESLDVAWERVPRDDDDEG